MSLQSKSNYVNVATYEGRKGEVEKVSLPFSDVRIGSTFINKLAIVKV